VSVIRKAYVALAEQKAEAGTRLSARGRPGEALGAIEHIPIRGAIRPHRLLSPSLPGYSLRKARAMARWPGRALLD